LGDITSGVMSVHLASRGVRRAGIVRLTLESLRPCESSQPMKETCASSAIQLAAPVVVECHSFRNLVLNRFQASDKLCVSARRAISSWLTLPDSSSARTRVKSFDLPTLRAITAK